MVHRNRRRRRAARKARSKRGMALLAIGIGCAVVVAVFFDDMGLGRYLAMRHQAESLKGEILRLEHMNRTLREDIRRVQHDSARIEELARERLGFVRDGETVYKIVRGSPR